MTQQEFEIRVKMNVSASEFDAVNDVYMNSDLDKDEFCKMWAKMNRSRIAKAAEERRDAEKKQADIEKAFDLFFALKEEAAGFSLAVAKLTADEREFAESIGIEMQEWSSWYGCNQFKTTLSVRCELGRFCGAIR